MREHQIVVIGGGYVGTLAAIRAAGKARRRAAVTLVDPDGVLVQRLRLHQVAAGQEIARPELAKLCGSKVNQVRGWATELDLGRGEVAVQGPTSSTTVRYDTLVLATGSSVDTGSMPGADDNAHALSDFAAATRLHQCLEGLPEQATVAVIGAGMTGLEAASEFAEARPDLRIRVYTDGEFGDWLSPAGREYLAKVFDRLGISVVERTRVAGVASRALEPEVGPVEAFDLALCCTGFTCRRLAADAGLAVDERGGVLVDRTLRSVSHPEVLAAGDAAAAPSLANGAVIRMTCQVGMPTGAHAADVVAANLRDKEATPFDFGYIHQPISLGRKDALIQWVDRADQPKKRILTGRTAACYKNVVSASAITSLRMERRLPGALLWPGSGANPAPGHTHTPHGATE